MDGEITAHEANELKEAHWKQILQAVERQRSEGMRVSASE
jgi:hypothetical protein